MKNRPDTDYNPLILYIFNLPDEQFTHKKL